MVDRTASETGGNGQGQNSEQQLIYNVEDVPSWYLCILLGFQHYLTMFGSTVAAPLFLAESLGIANDNVAKGQIISTIFFVSGISTLLQATFGTRLPIVQGAAFSFIPPTIAIFNSIKDMDAIQGNYTMLGNSTIQFNATANVSIWQVRMRTAQGAIMVASCLQLVLGFTGIIGLMMSVIGPITIAPTIALVGLSLYPAAVSFASKHWGISVLTMFLIILFSQYLRNIVVPLPKKMSSKGIKLFGLFPVIFAIIISWIICSIITAAGGFPANSSEYGYHARTDNRIDVMTKAAWFKVPYPCQWGSPIVTIAAVLGMLSGVLASIIESIGDYCACARLCNIPSPPQHAINRGIFMEGVGCFIAGLIGTGNGTTSYSENIGAIGITKVASRRVVQSGAVIMIILALFSKFGALFTTIPDPIVGGMFFVMFGMITAVGISSLQFVDLNSSRNLLIVGFSIFAGIAVPYWSKQKSSHDLMKTGSTELNQIIIVLMETGMFVGGVLAFLLDNTIPGTRRERGLLHRQDFSPNALQGNTATNKTFDVPGTKWLLSKPYTHLVPIFPNFRHRRHVDAEQNGNHNDKNASKEETLELNQQV